MTATDPEVEHFARLIDTLHSWLDQVVIIGGWGHRLYRLHTLAQRLNYEPLGALDADVAVPPQLPTNENDIRQSLLANGFHEELLGAWSPAAHYHVAAAENGFYAEFLTPLIGSVIKRGGKRRDHTDCGCARPKAPALGAAAGGSLECRDRSRRRLPHDRGTTCSCSQRSSFLGPENAHPQQTKSCRQSEGHPLHSRHYRDLQRKPARDPGGLGEAC